MMHFRPPFKWIALSLGLIALSGWGISAEIGDLSVTDASNTARFPEGLLAGQTNDNARALEGLLARGFKDTIDGVLTTTGNNEGITFNITANRTGVSSYYTGLRFTLMLHTNIMSQQPNLTINSISGMPMIFDDQTLPCKQNSSSCPTLIPNRLFEVIYNHNKWEIITDGALYNLP